MVFGICKLTGAKGTFVKSHLLPKALTRPLEHGEVRVEAGEGSRPTKRYDSWFDKTIVTRKGEDILEAYDTFAIQELRNHKLVWSSWPSGELTLPSEEIEPIAEDWGLRRIRFKDPKRLRLFCLSLLWRAAVTTRFGFTTISLSKDRLEMLRSMVEKGNAEPFEHFPVSIIQLTTSDGWHISSPTKETKYFEDVDGMQRQIGLYRFFLDGLVIHIEDETDDPILHRYKGIALGENEEQLVMTRPFAGSHQEERINGLMQDAYSEHSALIDRIFKGRS